MKEFILKYKWWILAAIAIIIIIIVIRKRGGIKSLMTGSSATSTNSWQPVTSAPPAYGGSGLTGASCTNDASFPLKLGSRGKQVGALQKFINSVPANTSNKVTVDCVFGEQT